MADERKEKPVWSKLEPDQRDLYLKLLWSDGYSEQAIADFLDTTKGTIVGRRRRLNVSNENRGTAKKEVNLDRFFDLLDLHKMEQVEQSSGGTVVCMTPIATPPKDAESLPAEHAAAIIEKPKIVPVKVPVVVQQKPKETRSHLCKWPLTSGGTLKEPALCDEPTLPGEELCEKHKKELLSHVRAH